MLSLRNLIFSQEPPSQSQSSFQSQPSTQNQSQPPTQSQSSFQSQSSTQNQSQQKEPLRQSQSSFQSQPSTQNQSQQIKGISQPQSTLNGNRRASSSSEAKRRYDADDYADLTNQVQDNIVDKTKRRGASSKHLNDTPLLYKGKHKITLFDDLSLSGLNE